MYVMYVMYVMCVVYDHFCDMIWKLELTINCEQPNK